MDTDVLKQAGLTELQAKIYLYLIKHGQSTPSQIATGLNESRTTIYSATQRLEALGIISQKDKGKISAYTPNHPSVLEHLAEQRLRAIARQAKNLEANLPSLINFYNEHQNEPGATTFYGQEGVDLVREKVLTTKDKLYFIRSPYDENNKTDPEKLAEHRIARTSANQESENITPSEFINTSNKYAKEHFLLDRTLLPPNEYDSPIEIDIFGDNVAFVNYANNGMSTLIESPEIADAMRQFFLFAKKYIRKATDQSDLDYKEKDPE